MGFSDMNADADGSGLSAGSDLLTGPGRVSVVIRRLDRETLACLQDQARRNARSVEAEMRLILTRAVAGQQVEIERVPPLVEEWEE